MNSLHLVALLAVVQYFAFAALVGRARVVHAIRAPAVSGHEQFERAFRVQMNTLEQLVAFLPALFVAGLYWAHAMVASIGAVYLVGRLVYRQAYVINPERRHIGFLLTIIPTSTLLVLGLVGAATRG